MEWTVTMLKSILPFKPGLRNTANTHPEGLFNQKIQKNPKNRKIRKIRKIGKPEKIKKKSKDFLENLKSVYRI